MYPESIQDLKDSSIEIIKDIETYNTDCCFVKNVMNQVAQIVTASNYQEMDIDIYETIEIAVSDINNKISVDVFSLISDNESSKKQFPSSIR